MSTYGVQAGALQSQIHVGRLNKARTEFLDKEVGTDMVLAAVAQYVERHFGGGMVADFPGLGLVLEVRVRPPDGHPTISGPGASRPADDTPIAASTNPTEH